MSIPEFPQTQEKSPMQLPSPSRVDSGLLTHAAIVLTVVLAITVLLAMGKVSESSATPLYGAALGFAPRATSQYSVNGEAKK